MVKKSGLVPLGKIGKSTEARLAWLVRFAERDARTLSEGDLEEAWQVLLFLHTGRRFAIPPWGHAARGVVLETHESLRGLFTALAAGKMYHFEAPSILWSLYPPAPRSPGARVSGRISRENEQGVVRKQTPAAVIFKAIDMLDEVGADRLRSCPLTSNGTRCGKLFLANGRQRFCGPKHAQRAAFQAFLQRGGDVKRKATR